MMPTGPSPPTSGILCSSTSESMIRGRPKQSVFPEPVKAMPTMSRPLRRTGRPWTWMGVGRAMPFFCSAFMMGSGNFMSLKALMGAGRSSPSQMMCHFLRNAWCGWFVGFGGWKGGGGLS